jgi:hypothetical protein
MGKVLGHTLNDFLLSISFQELEFSFVSEKNDKLHLWLLKTGCPKSTVFFAKEPWIICGSSNGTMLNRSKLNSRSEHYLMKLFVIFCYLHIYFILWPGVDGFTDHQSKISSEACITFPCNSLSIFQSREK